MGWCTWLFGLHGPEPVSRVNDPVFGPLVWSEDDEVWAGEYGGYRVAIGYYMSAQPPQELLVYAHEFLGPDGKTFTRNLAEARAAHAQEFQRWASEFALLRVEMLGFGMSKDGMGCFVDLIGGERDRSWRVEFDGMKCLGFGFDT
jgi:hypothetical protein